MTLLIIDDRHSSRQAALNTAGLHSTNSLAKHDLANWTPNGRAVVVKRLHMQSNLVDIDGYKGTVCGEVRPGNGDSTRSRRLSSQPGTVLMLSTLTHMLRPRKCLTTAASVLDDFRVTIAIIFDYWKDAR